MVVALLCSCYGLVMIFYTVQHSQRLTRSFREEKERKKMNKEQIKSYAGRITPFPY